MDAHGDRGAQSAPPQSTSNRSTFERAKRLVLGSPKDLSDRRVFHHISVVAFLAWVGLGADGLSSSSYGPDEAFRTLAGHTYLAVPLAILITATIWIISACYRYIIEAFPSGGGGYTVASALLGKPVGAVSGAALLIDYVLTIAVSIAAAGDAVFSMLPLSLHGWKLPVEALAICLLIVINLRGVKESIIALLPVFILFLVTHAALLAGGIFTHLGQAPETARQVGGGFASGYSALGLAGMVMLLLKAYSMGAGTYTGIEAVSNGLPIMREPRVRTARVTMVLIAVSLAVTASGLMLCYLLWGVEVASGMTLNAVLSGKIAGALGWGPWFVFLTLLAEGLLLVVASQTGFIDGPRVLANMALDGWVPRRFASLSERLTTQNGILLMGAAALAALLWTRGDIRQLVVMYSINVFLTFSLSMLGMARAQLARRRAGERWRRRLALFCFGLVFCLSIFGVTVYEKFSSGGWLTLAITGLVVAGCFWTRRHYSIMGRLLSSLYSREEQEHPPELAAEVIPIADPNLPTAVMLVNGYNGLGLHTVRECVGEFGKAFSNVIFISVGIIDSAAFREDDALEQARTRTAEALAQYRRFAAGLGLPSASRMAVGTDVVDELERLCEGIAAEYPHATYYTGHLVFRNERWYHRALHNHTALALQRRLQLSGHTTVILPILTN
jgi:amino acid transporter